MKEAYSLLQDFRDQLIGRTLTVCRGRERCGVETGRVFKIQQVMWDRAGWLTLKGDSYAVEIPSALAATLVQENQCCLHWKEYGCGDLTDTFRLIK